MEMYIQSQGDLEAIHQGQIEMCSSSKSSSKGNWLKKSISKPWKKRFVVLCRELGRPDYVSLVAFEKEDNWRSQKPKSALQMFPRYKISKKADVKAKEFVIEVNNEEESWYLAADNQRQLDLWAVQIQMQTKLSTSISGRIFSVMAASTKAMQRIGARDQRCLLSFTKWGLTLALQNSRAVLAMWPLDTIRNYECTGSGQFCVEAGRRSPMGEGKFQFFTSEGEDDIMFNVVDVFVNARLNERANMNPKRKNNEITDEEVLAAYDRLHSVVLGLTPDGIMDDDYARIENPTLRSSPRMVRADRPPSYNHLAREGLINPADDELDNSYKADRSSSFGPSTYDQLDRTQSWGSRSVTSEPGYDKIDRSNPKVVDGYDHIERARLAPFQSQPNYARFPSYPGDAHLGSPTGFPLSHEPSVPCIPDGFPASYQNQGIDSRNSSVSSADGLPVYRNAVYSPPKGPPSLERRISNGGVKQQKSGSVLRRNGSTSQADSPPKDALAHSCSPDCAGTHGYQPPPLLNDSLNSGVSEPGGASVMDQINSQQGSLPSNAPTPYQNLPETDTSNQSNMPELPKKQSSGARPKFVPAKQTSTSENKTNDSEGRERDVNDDRGSFLI